VQPSDRPVDELLDAILDGTPVDFAAAEPVCAAETPWARQLKVLAAIAEFHCCGTPPEPAHNTVLSSPSNEESATLWGHLRLLEVIGHGSFGEVYRAWDTRLEREVALKLLPAGSVSGARAASALIDEGRLLARVRHPNVVTIYGAEQIGNQIGLWMEFVRGRTLEQMLGEQAVVGSVEAIGLGIELCRAVSAVHAVGLLHRDIKTHNVMRADDGRIVLMDFGASREIDCHEKPDLAGTPLYLAPEVLGGGRASVQSDIYSLGVLMARLVTGSYPVSGRTVSEVCRAHERGVSASVRTVGIGAPRKLARVIDRAIDPRPERRYESVEELGTALMALQPRAWVARWSYTAGTAAAIMLAGALSWEVAGRQAGFALRPSALLVGPMEVSPVNRPVIAVRPFENLGSGPDIEYFADALTDHVIRSLALQGLEVRSPTSSFAFKDEPRSLRDISKQLGADMVVEGSAQQVGDRVRITVRLVRVEGDIRLWADQFEHELDRVVTAQDRIARGVSRTLGLTFSNGKRDSVTDVDTYELYLQARRLVDRRGLFNAQEAIRKFERVIQRDPQFAPAHAGLAIAYAFRSFPFRGIAFEKAFPIMRPAARKALELDPTLPEGHAAMGWVYAYEHDWVNAEKAFQRAIELNPTLTQAYTSYSISTLQPLEKYDQALRLLAVAERYDPLSGDVQREIGQVQFFSGRYTGAVETFQRIAGREPEFPFVATLLARALTLVGRTTEAFPLLEPGYPSLALAHVRGGGRAEAERLGRQWRHYPYQSTVIAAALGETDRAIEALERAAASEPHRIGRLLIEPELAPLRDHSRVLAIRKRFGLPK
jgi:TolB-like protein